MGGYVVCEAEGVGECEGCEAEGVGGWGVRVGDGMREPRC